MEIWTVTILHSIFFVSCGGFFFKKGWTGLQVTFGRNIFNSKYFSNLPRTVQEADKEGWVKISDCDLNAKWMGQRYVKDDDYAVILLFDLNDFIAGIQSSVPKGRKYPSSNIQPPFIEDGDRYFVTAYFIPPGNICTYGRLVDEFEAQGTGTDLYLQNTQIPEKSMQVPSDVSGLHKSKWKRGKCVWSMGVHYFYNITLKMNCDDYYPFFLLYNNEKLDAFGFSFLTDQLTSPRFEHPTSSDLHDYMGVVPSCLDHYPETTSMHVYLKKRSVFNMC